MRIALTGATGYVGSQLLPVLLAAGHDVSCLVRDPERAQLPDAARVIEGDVVTGAGLEELFDGASVAYYLVHSMDASGDFARRDREAAATFAGAARTFGVERVIYLGGLASPDHTSEHLRSRDEVAEILRDRGPRLVHARAAMVIGDGSASFQMLHGLVRHLPAMICPRWIDTRTQPVASGDVTRALAALATLDDPPPEAQLGGSEVLTYRQMMRRFAPLIGRRPPLIIGVPVLSPSLSSHWVSLFSPIDAALARPLVEGLGAEMIVTEPPPPGVNDDPLGFDDAVRAALA